MVENNGWIGIVGLGYWGKNILRNLNDLKVLRVACDTDPDSIASLKETYNNVPFTTSFSDLLDDLSIKAVAIATPAATHHKLVKDALLSGKDVFVEKPLALLAGEGEELVELAEKKKRILMVGHTLQYHPAVRKLKELISKGELGKVQYIYSNRLNIGKLRTEENILWSFAPHDISVILMLLEETPIEVTAFGEDYLNKGVYDTTLTTFEFANGVKGHIYVSWLHPYKEQRLVVVGTVAMAVFDDVAEDKLRIYPHRIEWRNGRIPIAHKADFITVPIDSGEPLRREMEHFISCVVDRTNPITDGREGLRVLEVLQRAEDAFSKRKQVKVKRQHDETFIHESAYVDEDVDVGSGTKIWHFSHVMAGVRVGQHCTLGQNVFIGRNVRIGDSVKIQNNVSVYDGVTLEDYVFCGPSVVFTNVIDARSEIDRKAEFRSTLVKHGATLGANCTILCGVMIGRYAFVGAGAVVTKDIPDFGLAVGVPAKLVGWVCECGSRLDLNGSETTCVRCNKRYRKGPSSSQESVCKI
jgi:UDP-2-acetamido-3-amino-2,3-dideoxy-glucuronate N-acetyltransferase